MTGGPAPVDRTQLPPLGGPTSLRFPDILRETLPNGVRLHVVDRASPLVGVTLLLRCGAASDPAGQAGLAGLTASVLDEATEHQTAPALHAALGALGARLSIDVGTDATVLSVTGLARHAAAALRLLVEVATTPRFAPADVERLRTLRLHRIAQRRHSAAAVADRVFLDLLYGEAHPYGHPSIGTAATLAALGADDVRRFHATHYGPARWTVVAAGGHRAVDLARLVRDGLDGLEPVDAVGSIAPPAAPRVPPARLVFVARDGAAQTELRVGMLGVTRHVDDYLPLTVVDTVLGGQFASRLNLTLREAKGYTYGVRSAFEARLGRGPFVVRTAVEASATGEAVREIIREVRAIRTDRPMTAHELAVAQSSLARGFVRSFETVGQVAGAAMRLALFDLPDDEYSTYVTRLTGVTRDAATAAARRHLDPDRLVAIAVGPPSVRPMLGDLGLGEPVDARTD